MANSPSIELLDNSSVVALHWPDGATHRFHAIWLRDHAQDDLSRDPHNGQKKITALDLDPKLGLTGASIDAEQIRVDFSDGHQTSINLQWLKQLQYDRPATLSLLPSHCQSWGSELEVNHCSADFSVIQNDSTALHQWLTHTHRFGFSHLRGVPRQTEALFKVIDLFGFVRETNYGRSFEVRSEADPVNLAFTRMGLDPHTDNPYRDPTPTLQILHCLENDAEGGESIVVDGFRAAERLHQETAEHFELLSRFDATFSYSGDGKSSLSATRPMLELSSNGSLRQVRINNRAFQGPVDVPYDLMPAYYQAYRHLIEITLRPSLEVRFKLGQGELFMVDNTRVLHGRSAFDATGSRWLQGAYADIDGLQSTIRLLEQQLK